MDWNCYHHLSKDYKRTIFWCGGDVLRLQQYPDRVRILNLFPVEHWCETEQEAGILRSFGIEPNIGYSFLEDIGNFGISQDTIQAFKEERRDIWLSAHTEREKEYGVDVAFRMALRFPKVNFHIYGTNPENNLDLEEITDGIELDNFIIHGIVPNEQFNSEIKGYHAGLRCNTEDGFSEVPIKAILMGQYAITRMKFPHFWNYQNDEELESHIQKLIETKEPNLKAREYYIPRLNNFPWVKTGYPLKCGAKTKK